MDTRTDGQGAPKNADEAIELGQKSINAIADLTRQNMEVMMAVAHVATHSFQAAIADVADFSKKSLERAAVAARAMTTVTSPSELAHLQTEFAKTQFEAARAEMLKFSDSMFRAAREQLAAQRTSAPLETRETTSRPPSLDRTKA